MPYVKQEARRELDKGRPAKEKGELNYVVTREALRFIDMQVNGFGARLGYAVISEAIGALRDAADEMARRLLTLAEERAIKKNGDMYPVWMLEVLEGKSWEAPYPTGHETGHPGYNEDKLRHCKLEEDRDDK